MWKALTIASLIALAAMGAAAAESFAQTGHKPQPAANRNSNVFDPGGWGYEKAPLRSQQQKENIFDPGGWGYKNHNIAPQNVHQYDGKGDDGVTSTNANKKYAPTSQPLKMTKEQLIPAK